MPLFGAHTSVAGGLNRGVEAARLLGMEAMQIFTKNANQWSAKPLIESDIRGFRDAVSDAGLKYCIAHDSYLINLAAADDALFQKSCAALIDELERAEALGLDYLVTHPGAHTGSGEEAGLARIIMGLDLVLGRCEALRVRILLETTAGQGTTLGHRFEHLGAIIGGVRHGNRLGTCFDTCHVFAAGYPLSSRGDYEATMQEFDVHVGLQKLLLFHLNDSVKPLGCRVDRHAGIGAGEIGENGFRRIVHDPRFRDLPMILETPKEDADGEMSMDAVNLAELRGMKPVSEEEDARMTTLFS